MQYVNVWRLSELLSTVRKVDGNGLDLTWAPYDLGSDHRHTKTRGSFSII